jgi:hypothetical protein
VVTSNDLRPILALVRDLLFSSRISATARAMNRQVKIIRDPAQLPNEAGTLLIVDLNLAGAVEAAAAWKTGPGRQVVGFVSHVDTETVAKARSLGIDRVMARSRFVEVLPKLFAGAVEGSSE